MRVTVGALAAMAVAGPAFAMTFGEAVKVCEAVYGSLPNVADDGATTFPNEDRVNVVFDRSGRRTVCSVGKTNGKIEQVRAGDRTFEKREVEEVAAILRAGVQDRDSIAKGDYAAFVKRAKRALTARFKDPDSAKFRDLYISGKGLPTLCGEVNAKNSYGAYVGYKGFFYNSVSSYIDDGKELGNGFMYREMQPKACGEKIVDIEQ